MIKNGCKERMLAIFIYILLGCIAAFLCLNFSKDFEDYLWLYNLTLKKDWIDVFSLFQEPLYFGTVKLLGPLIGYSWLISIFIIISLSVKLYFLNKITGVYWLIGTFFYICLCLFLFDATVLRAGFALTFIFISMYFLKEEKIKYSLLFLFIASLTHLSSLLFLLMYLFYFVRASNAIVLLLFFSSPAFLLLQLDLLFEALIGFTSIFTEKYQFYAWNHIIAKQNTTGLYYYFVISSYFAVLAIYVFLRNNELKDTFKQVMFSLSACAVIAMCLFHTHVIIGARIGELLLVSMVPLLSWLYCWFAEKQLVFFKYSLIFISVAYAVARMLYLFPDMFAS